MRIAPTPPCPLALASRPSPRWGRVKGRTYLFHLPLAGRSEREALRVRGMRDMLADKDRIFTNLYGFRIPVSKAQKSAANGTVRRPLSNSAPKPSST